MTNCEQTLIPAVKLRLAEEANKLFSSVMPWELRQKLTKIIQKLPKELPDPQKDIDEMLKNVSPEVKKSIGEILDREVSPIRLVTLPQLLDVLSKTHHSIEDLEADYLQYAIQAYKRIVQNYENSGEHYFILFLLQSLLGSIFPEIFSALEDNSSLWFADNALHQTLVYATAAYNATNSQYHRKVIRLFLEALHRNGLIESSDTHYDITPYNQLVRHLLGRYLNMDKDVCPVPV